MRLPQLVALLLGFVLGLTLYVVEVGYSLQCFMGNSALIELVRLKEFPSGMRPASGFFDFALCVQGFVARIVVSEQGAIEVSCSMAVACVPARLLANW